MNIDSQLMKDLENFQRDEITEYHIYRYLAEKEEGRNREVLQKISEDELRHYNTWKEITGRDVEPDWNKIRFYKLMYRIFGLVFSLKLMERGERKAEERYKKAAEKVEIAKEILKDEFEHEDKLLSLLTDERLQFIGSIVLGLSDALIELTGALTGLSLALYNTLIVGLAALITGIAASMSMAVSEYLSKRSEGDVNAVKGALYTGMAYIITVLLIVMPFFLGLNIYLSLASSLIIASLIIAALTFYTSVVREITWKREFMEMLVLTMGVAFISFSIGYFIRLYFNIEV